VEDLPARLANERVIKVLLVDQRRGLVRDVVTGGEDRCGCRSSNESELADIAERSRVRSHTVGAG